MRFPHSLPTFLIAVLLWVLTNAASAQLHHFKIEPLETAQIRNAPASVSITARNAADEIVTEFSGTVTFTATGTAGTVSCTLGVSSRFVEGQWTGFVGFGTYDQNVILTATSGGSSGTSNAFNVGRGPLDRFAWNPIGEQVENRPFPVTVHAVDRGGNLVEEFTGSADLSILTSAVRNPTSTSVFSTDTAGLSGNNRQGRVQAIYYPQEVGGAGLLSAMELDLTSRPTRTLKDFTIRLKHTQKANYNSAGNQWDTEGWTTVHVSTASIANTGWVKFSFSTGFQYDGVSNLMVDFSYNNDSYSFSGGQGTYKVSSSSPPSRTISWATTFPAYGATPLLWNASAPSYSTFSLPILRFSSMHPAAVALPTAGSFISGIWAGEVTIPFAEPLAALKAEQGSQNGFSNLFNVTKMPPAIGFGVFLTENFNAGLPSSWQTGGTDYSLVTTTTSPSPYQGSSLFLSRSFTSPSNFAVRSEATWSVNLAGLSGLKLKFWTKGFGGSPHGPPPSPFLNNADFDGVAISADGTTWYEIKSLRSIPTTWTSYVVDLDQAIRAVGLQYTNPFYIRFNSVSMFPMLMDGLAIDDVQITSELHPQAMRVTVPATMQEAGAPGQGSVTLPLVSPTATTIQLTSAASNRLSVPTQITIPAGQLTGYFSLAPIDNAWADGPKIIAITATHPLLPIGAASVTVQDDEQPTASLSVPASIPENAVKVNATVTLSLPTTSRQTFTAVSSHPTIFTVPAQVEVPPGRAVGEVSLTILNNINLDGPKTATLTLTPTSGQVLTATVNITDDETSTLRLFNYSASAPAVVTEGAGTLELMVNLGGAVATATTLTYSSSNPARIAPPGNQTINAGSLSASPVFSVVNDNVPQVTESVTLTATAPGFPAATYVVEVRDNDPHHFTITPIDGTQIGNAPIPVTITARDSNEQVVEGFTGPATLSSSHGTVIPGTITEFFKGVWTGTVQINHHASGATLQVASATSQPSASTAFDLVAGPYTGLAWAPLPPVLRPGTDIPLTVFAADAGRQVVSTINGPVTLRAMAPTAGNTMGEYAYSARAHTENTISRMQFLYVAHEIGAARWLSGLSLHTETKQSAAHYPQWTIRLKPTAKTTLGGITTWDNEGWTTVHQSSLRIVETGWVDCLFDVPFFHDGQSNLLVEISYRLPTGEKESPTLSWDGSGVVRTLYGSSSQPSNPLLWVSGTEGPKQKGGFPVLRLFDLQPVATNLPAQAVLANGTWTGTISFPGPVNPLFLEATDANQQTSYSNRLNIERPVVATLPFAEDFEGRPFFAGWKQYLESSTAPQVIVPATGNRYAALDHNHSLSMILPVNLRGYSERMLKFKVKRLVNSGSFPTAPFSGNAEFTGVAISADGVRWQGLDNLSSADNATWKEIAIGLELPLANVSTTDDSTIYFWFQVKPDSTTSTNGISLDDISITGTPTGKLTLNTPAVLTEDAAPTTGTVSMPFTMATDMVIPLQSTSPRILSVPSSVTIPAGQLSASFPITPTANPEVTGQILVTITASTSGVIAGDARITTVNEVEPLTLALEVPATLVPQTNPYVGTITISSVAKNSLTVGLISSLVPNVQVPAAVTIPPGVTTVTFPIQVTKETGYHRPRNVTLSAVLAGAAPAEVNTSLLEEAAATLTVGLLPIMEGGSTNIAVTFYPTSVEATTVTLTSSNPTLLALPATVTIPAGGNYVSFTMTAADNATIDGPRQVAITASTPYSNTVTQQISIIDNELGGFAITAPSSDRIRGVAFPVTIKALNAEGQEITNYQGTANLTASGLSGAVGITPTTATLAAGTWTGNVTASAFGEQVRITASTPAGYQGASNPFNVGVGPITHYAWANIPSPQLYGLPITATLTARDAGENLVIGHSGYAQISTTPLERTIGSGTATTTDFPARASSNPQRTQAVYLISELNGPGMLNSLSLYFNHRGDATLQNWTIRLKHTPFATTTGWDNNGWTTVYTGNVSVTQSGWFTFPFSTPFTYNGTSHLLVDFSLTSAPANTYPGIRLFTASTNRVIQASSAQANLLLWSGTTPFPISSTNPPQIKFNSGFSIANTAPQFVYLAGGSWTGSLWTQTGAVESTLTATDFLGLTGTSNLFSVQSVPDSDADGLPNWWETASGLNITSNGGVDGPLGDVDLDGIVNLLEYAFVLDSGTSNREGLPRAEARTHPGDGKRYLEFTFRRRIGAPGLTYTIETSSDCVNWLAEPGRYETVSGPLPLADGITETVTYRIHPALETPGTPTTHLRVRVSTP